MSNRFLWTSIDKKRHFWPMGVHRYVINKNFTTKNGNVGFLSDECYGKTFNILVMK